MNRLLDTDLITRRQKPLRTIRKMVYSSINNHMKPIVYVHFNRVKARPLSHTADHTPPIAARTKQPVDSNVFRLPNQDTGMSTMCMAGEGSLPLPHFTGGGLFYQ